MRLNQTLLLVAAFAFSFALVARAPASLLRVAAAAANGGFSFVAVEGTLWRGVMRGARSGGIMLGDVEYELSPLPLLIGRVDADIAMRGGSVTGAGRVVLARHSVLELDDARFSFDLSAAGPYRFLGEALSGAVAVDVDRIRYSSTGCREADFVVRTDALTAPARKFGAQAFPLNGRGVCDGDDLSVTLSGKGEDGAAEISLALSPSRSYALTATVAPTNRELARALEALGFEYRNGALTIASEGAIRVAGS